jgi:hypothetical protein
MTRKPNSLWPRFLKLGVIALCLFPLAGCWTTADEVIPVKDGVTIPYTTYRTKMLDGRFLYLSQLPGSNDYSYRYEPMKPEEACTSNEGTFRAIRIRGNIFAVQVKCKIASDSDYYIVLYQITAETYKEVEPDLTNDVMKARLARYNLEEDIEGKLRGAPSRILSFLKDLDDVSFRDSTF